MNKLIWFSYGLVSIGLICGLTILTAHAELEGSIGNGNSNSGASGYVSDAINASNSAAASFNAQDAAASAAASQGVSQGGIYGNSGTAISQFQRQFTAANQTAAKMTAALNSCLEAADKEIAAAEAELAAAESTTCSHSSDDSGSGSSDNGCESAKAAAIAAAQAKIAQANANKTACSNAITPQITAVNEAAGAVKDAAFKAGFTLSASDGKATRLSTSNKTATSSTATTTAQLPYVAPIKMIDTTSAQFWSQGSGTYPGSSTSMDALLNKLPGSTTTKGSTVHVAANYGDEITEEEGLVGDWRTDSKGITTFTGADHSSMEGRIVQFDKDGLIFDNAQP